MFYFLLLYFLYIYSHLYSTDLIRDMGTIYGHSSPYGYLQDFPHMEPMDKSSSDPYGLPIWDPSTCAGWGTTGTTTITTMISIKKNCSLFLNDTFIFHKKTMHRGSNCQQDTSDSSYLNTVNNYFHQFASRREFFW